MAKWLSERRFNYIDALTLGATAIHVHDGEWLMALTTVFFGAALSVLVEGKARK